MWDDVKNYFANFGSVADSCRTVALWVVIAMAIAFIATRLYVFVAAGRGRMDETTVESATKLINGSWIVAAIAVAVCIIVAFVTCYFVDVANGKDELVPILFYPLLVLVLAAVGSAIALVVKPTILVKTVCAAVCGAALVSVIVCMAVYYASGDAVDNNYGTDVLSNIGLYLSAAVLVVGIVTAAVLIDRHSAPFDTRTITFAAVCVALSFALSYVRLFKMPMGGSITFASMLPIMLFAFIFGSRKGLLVGLVYGILQAIQDPWIIHPAQFALDYAVAFAAIGLTGCMRELGLFKNNMRLQFALGACIACLLRLISHYFAGVFAFGVYGAGFADSYGMPALANEYLYSFVYQCMYIIPELAIVIVVGMLVFASGNFRRQIQTYITKYGTKKSEEVRENNEEVTANNEEVKG